MLYVIWGILVIPVIAAGMTLHFKIKEWGKQKWNILPKCLSTWMIVCTGFLGIWARGDSQGLDKKWILAALLLFLLADGLLEIQFFLGMGVFGAGHLILIGWFLTRGAYTPVSFFWWLLFMGISLYIFRGELEGGKENPWLYVMILYPAVLMGMTAVAIMLPAKLGPDYLRAGIGALLFAVSDLMVGKGFFHKLSRPMSVLALSLYYAGIFCISLITWI